MTRLNPKSRPSPLPAAHLEVVQRLEDQRIQAWRQGDGLLADLLYDAGLDGHISEGAKQSNATPTRPSRVLLCDADATRLLEVFPNAVVTSDGRRRLSLGTAAGPIDLLPQGGDSIESVLLRFGLSALAIAWQTTQEVFCDPTGALDGLAHGQLDVISASDDPRTTGANADTFRVAPRRFWITARLLSEYDLIATPSLIGAARNALPDCRHHIPEGAPARRAIERVLAGANPTAGLLFLHETGLCEALFPGMQPAGAVIMNRLAENPSLRWAAWIAGSATQKALGRFRMPMRKAREIERLLRHHPIDLSTKHDTTGENCVRRLQQRLHPDEIEGLLAWRELELKQLESTNETRASQGRLLAIRQQLESMADEQSRTDRVRRLAIDGARVMKFLGLGPGRHIGQALKHLAEFVEKTPDANEIGRLESELRSWSEQHPD